MTDFSTMSLLDVAALNTFTDLMRQYGETEVSLFHGSSNLIAKVTKR